MTAKDRLDAALQRLGVTAIAVHRARMACNGQHSDPELRRLLKAEEQARVAHAEAIFNHGEAHAAAHSKESA